ncbi:MAG: carbamoyltransferase [Gammaproteobacteria bacterium]|jgi:carbamoyltransferase
MRILGVHTGHDAAAALTVDGELVAYCKEDRLTRVKSDSAKRRVPGRALLDCIDEVLEIAGLAPGDVDVLSLTRMDFPYRFYRRTAHPLRYLGRRLQDKSLGLARQLQLLKASDEGTVLDHDRLRRELGLREDCTVRYANHHLAHVLGAFRYTTWDKDALYISADGGGDFITYSAYSWDGRNLECIYGGDRYLQEPVGNRYAASIGQAYSFVTGQLGFKPNRHEGKLTGLAAFGEPRHAQAILSTFRVGDDGVIDSTLRTSAALRAHLGALGKNTSREDMAASIQNATEQLLLQWIGVLRKRFPARRIGLSGGVFSNVRLNQHILAMEGIEEIFVMPPMGDEGLPVGNCIDADIADSGIESLVRGPLRDAYLGRVHDGKSLLDAAAKRGFRVEASEDAANLTGLRLANGEIGAIFAERMEMGPRALGARSIVASPADAGLNDELNRRLERTEFMPFAPYVNEADAAEVFDIHAGNREACRFMTVTTDVRAKYRERIPAVVHVDGTARPQLVERHVNPLYFDTLEAFKRETGIPALVNTSFNAHEEPIINTPDQALDALRDSRVDFLFCTHGLVFRNDA